MPSYSTIAEYLLVALIAQYVVRWILFIIFGVWIGYFNPFNLSLTGCLLKTDDTNVQIRKIKLRLSPFSRYRKFVTLKLGEIIIERSIVLQKDQNKQEKSADESVDKLVDKLTDKFVDNNSSSSFKSREFPARDTLYNLFDPSMPVKIYTDNNKFRRLMRLLLTSFPNCSVLIDDIRLILPDDIGFRVHNLRVITNIDSKNSKNGWKMSLPFHSIEKKSSWMCELKLEELVMYDVKSSEIISQFMAEGRITANFFIDLKKGLVSGSQFNISTALTKISVLQLMSASRRLATVEDIGSTKASNSSTNGTRKTNLNESPFPSDVDDIPISTRRRLFRYGLILRILSNADISTDQLQIFDIPLGSKTAIDNILDNPNNHPKADGVVMAQFNMRAMNFNASKLLPNQVGYDLRFSANDLPIQLLFSVLSMNISMDFSRFPGYSGQKKIVEVLSLSNLTISAHTTAPTNVLKLLLNRTKGKQGETVISFKCTIIGLTLDLTTEQMDILISKRENSNNRMIVEKQKKKYEATTATSDETSRFARFLRVYVHYVLKSCPWIAFKVLIEKPVFILKVADENDKGDGSRFSDMLIITPSVCGFELQIDKNKNQTEFEARLDTPNVHVDYRRRRGKYTERVATLKDAQLKSSATIRATSKLQVSVFGNFSFANLNLTDVRCLNGLRSIVNSVTDNLSINAELSAIADDIRLMNKKPFNPAKLFQKLPGWFRTANVSIDDVTVQLGARSIFMPRDVLVSEQLPEELKHHFDSDSNYLLYHLTRLNIGLNNNDGALAKVSSDDDSSSRVDNDVLQPEDYYWAVTSTFDFIKIRALYTKLSYDDKRGKVKIITVPQTTLGVYAVKKPQKFLVYGNCDRAYLNYTLAAHFLVVSSIYLFNNTLGDVEVSKKKKKKTKTNKKPLKKVKISDLVDVHIRIKEIQVKVILATEFQIRLDLYRTDISLEANPLIVGMKLVRFCVMTEDTLWYRSVGLKDLVVKYNLKAEKDEKVIDASTDRIIVNIPFNFIVHRLFDSISSTVKLTKQMHTILKSNEVKTKLRPKEISKPTIFKHTEIKSQLLSILFDDDTFECELAMTYQLGLLEQRDRLAKMKKFENYAEALKSKSSSDDPARKKIDQLLREPWLMDSERHFFPGLSKKMYRVAMNISKSWIATVNEYKEKKKLLVDENIRYLHRLAVNTSECSKQFSSNLNKIQYDPPLFSIFLEDLKLILKEPRLSHDDGQVINWVNRVGAGVPLDTKFSTLVSFHASLHTSRLRVHLKDYPIPIAYIPKAQRYSTKNTFVLEGNMGFYEDLALTEKQLRWVYTAFLPGCQKDVNDKYLALTVPRSLSTLKVLGELIGRIRTDRPSSFTWAESLTAAFRQLTISFDKLSKPKTDPSPKLGIWDKLRNMMHGFIRLYWVDPTSELRVNIKGSMDPYKLLGSSAGFTLSFKDDICWQINDPKREFDRDFLMVSAKRVIWAIPNYLSEPLPCWCSPKLVYLAADPENVIIQSMYGYYLNQSCLYEPDSEFTGKLAFSSRKAYMKININLTGTVTVKLSFVFERRLPDGTRTSKFKPHYKNVLCHPDYVGKDVDHYDSYEGFRSNYIHMGFTLKTEDSSMNSIHLTPESLSVFMKWFKLFSNNMATPIRNGKLWESRSKSVKFSRHLFTFKFLFIVEPLYLYHGYRIDLSDPDSNEIIGMKARVSKFELDLHMRKEPMVEENLLLERQKQIMHMKFNVGVLVFDHVDLRAVNAEFSKKGVEDDDDDGSESSSSGESVQFSIFDNDEDWIDIGDYSEVGLHGLDDFNLKGKVLPLLDSTLLRYSMHRTTKSDFGNEDSHECQVSHFHLVDTNFNNVLEAQDLELKWNCEVRDTVFQYLREVAYRDSYRFSTNFKAMRLVQQRLSAADNSEDTQSAKFENVEKYTVENFDAELREVDDFLPDLIPIDFFLVRLSNLQIQMINNDFSDSMLLLSTSNIDLQVVKIQDATRLNRVGSTSLEMRMGTIFESADISVMYKKDVPNSHDGHIYGSTSNWPVFNDSDGTYSKILARNKILSKVQIIFRYDKMSSTIENDSKRDHIFLDVPSFETAIDSDACVAISSLVVNLLIYSEPEMKKMNQMVRKMVLATDFSNLQRIYDRSTHLTDELMTLGAIRSSLGSMESLRDDIQEPYLKLRKEISRCILELFVYTRTLISGGKGNEQISGDSCKFEMLVTAKQFTVNMKMEDKEFLTLKIEDSMFRRLEMTNGSTQNVLKVRTINAWNRDSNIMFPELLTRYQAGENHKYDDSMIAVHWSMGPAVGGIRVIKKMKVFSQPLKLEVEEKTGRKFQKFLFHDDGEEEEEGEDEDEDKDDIMLSAITSTNTTVSSSTMKSKRHRYPTHALHEIMNLHSENVGADEMVKRAKNYFNINHFTFDNLTICISIYGKGKLRILNVNRFVLRLNSFRLDNRMLTLAQLVNAIESHVLKSLLKHSGKLVTNKLFTRSRKRISNRAAN
ncbi:hypothetical protein FOA43_004223 [Brettanomyces nanus]|uniref:Uncharacterized protein n=1 Tax=Eeniella nana TaxID=13502 RepID=A0A875SBB1_EENNA|nr:uncharacterized protein FOA43_004223 [Brettanomyces nanus]QPG76829.1 hypothetical protein FOA43_004223 [Brettanomyces nanus]